MEETATFRANIKPIVQKCLSLDPNKFGQTWHHICADADRWHSNLPAELSFLSSRLDFLKRVCDAFDCMHLKDHDEILQLIGSETGAVGDTVNLVNREYAIVSKAISTGFTLQFRLVDPFGQHRLIDFAD